MYCQHAIYVIKYFSKWYSFFDGEICEKPLCRRVGGSTRFELLKMKIYEQAEVGIVPSILIDRRTRSKL